MITIAIQGQTPEELKTKVSELALAWGVGAASGGKATAGGRGGKGADVKAAVGSTATVVEPKEEPVEEADPLGDEEAAADEAPTKEDVKQILTELRDLKKGDNAVITKVLAPFGVKSFAQLKEEQYGDVIAAAKKLMK